MFENLSYRSKLLWWLMPTLVVGILTLSTGAYWYINNIIEEELTMSMLAATGKTAEGINTWFKTLMLEPETIASTPAAKAINNDFTLIDAQNINRYKFLREKYPDIFQDIYAANRHGEYHTVQKSGNDHSLFIGNISTRDYFQSIMSGGPAQITSPLNSRTTGSPTIFIVAPIKDEGNHPQGLIGIGISLEYVQKIVENLKTGQTGYGVIVAQDGTIIYHPNKDFVMKKKVTEQDIPGTGEIGKIMISGGSGIYRYKFNGQKKVAFYQPIPLAGWSVATLVSEEELFAPAIQMIKSLAMIMLVILILMAIIILIAARQLTKPLSDLALHAQDIAAGNLVVKALEVKSQDEIGQLTANFNNMTIQLAKRDAELHKTYDELEMRVLERTNALAEANHSLHREIAERRLIETKMAHMDRLNVVGEVAAGIGHEVRNPMTTVRGYLQLFQRKEEFVKYHDQFAMMIEELDRANSIITEFLSLAKNKPVEKKQGNLNSVIKALFPILQAEAFQKGHQLQAEIGEIPDSVFDEKEIRQLILNMVSNGLEAMERSGLVIIKTYSENSNIILAIQDTGSGIPAEVLDKLGTPFVTTKDSGTGLGLSICYRIAARHDAIIKVSTGSEGTTFTIILPCHPLIL
ncbi:MAG: signal transduction histidine kinase, nitrogen specific, NtrB [Firmicutes bacterium]|nr:signal transduction histidine kinase, nitrogen specific, NtrB [Bacillota bacterium]